MLLLTTLLLLVAVAACHPQGTQNVQEINQNRLPVQSNAVGNRVQNPMLQPQQQFQGQPQGQQQGQLPFPQPIGQPQNPLPGQTHPLQGQTQTFQGGQVQQPTPTINSQGTQTGQSTSTFSWNQPALGRSFQGPAAAKANNEFGFTLLRQLRKNGGNIFFSPFNIGSVLAMTYLGARGETANEIANALNLQYVIQRDLSNPVIVHEAYKGLFDEFNRPDDAYTLLAANGFFPSASYVRSISPDYLQKVRYYYDVEPKLLDFGARPDEAAKTINDWVGLKTSYNIQELFKSDSFNADTRLVLVSAIYFKGLWKKMFSSNETQPEQFNLLNKQQKTVDMMQITDATFKYYQDPYRKLKMIELPYTGGKVSMFVILPDPNEPLPDLSHDVFNQLRESLEETELTVVKLPKFKLETKYDQLQEDLMQLNITTVFQNGADLSGLNTRKDLYISKIVHQATLVVDESGSEASAATGGSVFDKSTTPKGEPNFVADRPFFVFLADTKYKTILFQGLVTDPSPQ